MNTSEFFPYRSEAARAECLAYLDSLAAKSWPIASESRTVPTSYGDTFVRIGGPSGAPMLVLLHGAGTTSLMWAPNIGELSREFRTVAVDQIGEFGRSVSTRPILSIQDQLTWLNELFEALEPGRPIHLAGLSYGGALAAQYALHFPEKLSRLVLIAPGATVLRPPAQFWLRLTLLAIARRRGLMGFFRWIFADMTQKDPQWIEATVELLSLNMRSTLHHKTPFPPVLTDAQWAGLKTPALFLVGEHEVIYSAENAVARLKRVAPRIATEIIPGAGHDLSIVQADAVNGRIVAFLRGQALEPAGPIDSRELTSP